VEWVSSLARNTQMRTREHVEVMNGFAAIAEEFIDTGNVLG
jgi:hypothetical protein